MSDYPTAVMFRREKSNQEVQRDGTAAGRWVDLGATMMDHVPAVGEYLWLNGKHYVIGDRSWSLNVVEPPNQPDYEMPQVMLTLRWAYVDRERNSVPLADFRR